MTKSLLSEADFRKAAQRLKCDLASIKAVAEVESPKGPFLADGRPTILFEPHIFAKHTKGRFNKSHPDISYPKWKPGTYGPAGAHQHNRMGRAAELDREAALKSASWGQFQILGENFRQAGFPSVQGFINAMYHSASAQLEAFVTFNLNDPRLVTAIRNRMWATYARIYNGPAYATHEYDVKLARAYAKWAAVHPAKPNFDLVRGSVTSTERMV